MQHPVQHPTQHPVQHETPVELFVPEAVSRELSRLAEAARKQSIAAAKRALARDLPGMALLVATEFAELATLYPEYRAPITEGECPTLEGRLLTCATRSDEDKTRHIDVFLEAALVLDVRLTTIRGGIREAQPPYALMNGLDLAAGDVYAYLPGDWEQVLALRAATAYAQHLLARYNALQHHYLTRWGIALGDIAPSALQLSEEQVQEEVHV